MSFWKMVFAVFVGNMLTVITLLVLSLLFMVALGNTLESMFKDPNFQSRIQQDLRDSGVAEDMKEVITQPLKQLNADLEKQNRELARARAKRAEHAKLVNSAKEMCEYWAAEFRKDGTEESEAYMDNACMRWRKLLNSAP
ncbi:hypothetical protein RE428_36010 [Marinobacter nanhaiticus D15-8W]|uniref:Uncharacterized protein n=1 Tax=Marinobacter nanhaiticus D15-8W TaxID=626887 RepID=N6W948_9GAMM|nr:hypothetical protein [Marinobacter nanhaiticus]ENO16769.2 hypothetical protein J057_03655 [Marinobacter nanhaiticus D15-8W]BES72583.1 hypothetical protein RE428_36010 [Marinobacter nanhaiticus D15-8W]